MTASTAPVLPPLTRDTAGRATRACCRRGEPTGVIQTIHTSVTGAVDPIAYDCVKIMLIGSGHSFLFGPHGEYEVHEGQIVILAAGTAWGGVPLDPVEVTTVYVNRDYLLDQFSWHAGSNPAHREHLRAEIAAIRDPLFVVELASDSLAESADAFDRMLRRSRRSGDSLQQAGPLLDLLNAMFPVEPPATLENTGEALLVDEAAVPAPIREEIATCLRLIDERYAEAWRISDLARTVSISESTLRRAFKMTVGLSPGAYLARVRVGIYAKLLRETTLTCWQAAQAAGFCSASQARALFQREVGMSPNTFRQVYTQ